MASVPATRHARTAAKSHARDAFPLIASTLEQNHQRESRVLNPNKFLSSGMGDKTPGQLRTHDATRTPRVPATSRR